MRMAVWERGPLCVRYNGCQKDPRARVGPGGGYGLEMTATGGLMLTRGCTSAENAQAESPGRSGSTAGYMYRSNEIGRLDLSLPPRRRSVA